MLNYTDITQTTITKVGEMCGEGLWQVVVYQCIEDFVRVYGMFVV